jgi:hypothetical protein
MRLIRKTFFLRCFCALSILLMLNGIIYPTICNALTTGPHQPEYTSYEDPGASDMVNLITGDFTFNAPLLTVPIGAEGAFTVPLSYHGGVGPDQEASWVGFGWNLNPGSITRDINGFPDDANSESQTVTVQDLNIDHGWTSNFFGQAIGWDANEGHFGVIDLTAGLGLSTIGYDANGINSYGMRGLTMSSSGKVNFHGATFALTLAVAVVIIVLDVLTYGAGGTALAASLPLAVDIAMQVATQAIMDIYRPNPTPELGTQGYWALMKETRKVLFHTDYWIYLNQTRIEDMFGVLNLDKATPAANTDPGNFLKIKQTVNANPSTISQFQQSTSTLNRGAASDINTDLYSTTNYWDNTSPALLAYDNFNVNGPGISGGIKPYRMELGSVSVPREMTSNHVRLDPIPYLDYGSSKVPFVYEGSMGNAYFNHVGNASTSSPVTSPSFNYGINSAFESSTTGTPGPNTNYLRYDLNDFIVGAGQQIRSDVATTRKIPQGHFVDWLTNVETANPGAFTSSAYMDYFRSSDRSQFRNIFTFGGRTSYYSTGPFNGNTIYFEPNKQIGNNFAPNHPVDVNLTVYDPVNTNVVINSGSYTNVNVDSQTANSINVTGVPAVNYGNPTLEVISKNASKPNTAIGGFVVTDPSGMNYHFALPVYDYSFYSKSWQKADPTKTNVISRTSAFANTWLLTAITGPDFVDRGGTGNTGDGYIDENDWGYWVKFNYAKAGDDFAWSIPYNKQKPSSDDLYYTYASGNKEKYFLNTIETRSHVAMFIKDTRSDAKDAGGIIKPTMRLAEIDLITKDTYRTLTGNKYKLPDVSGKIDFAYTLASLQPVSLYRANFLRASAIRRVVFNHDYSLCPGVSTSTSGKLTLNSLTIAAKYDTVGWNVNKIFPDYKFEYAVNPGFDANKWDGWGMYSSIATSSGLTHKASPVDADGAAWSLTKVTNPEGSEIIVNYERDNYNSISGSAFPATDFTMSGSYTVTPTLATISVFNINDPTFIKVGDQMTLSGTFSFTCPGDSNPTLNPFNSVCTVLSVVGNTVTLTSPYGNSIHCPVGSNLNVTVSGAATQVVKKGGNLRVASLQLNDPSGQSYKTQYLYSNGTVSIEPDYIKSSDLLFYKYLNYPATPVLYGQVTVLTGKLTTPSDFDSRQVYNFITPNTSQYAINTTKVKDKVLTNNYNNSKDYSSLIKHEISRHTNQIGKINSIATYDASNSLVSQSNYYYTESPTNNGINNYQGIFSEGTLLFEAVMATSTSDRYHRAQRTTSLTYPSTLQKVVTTTDGFTSQTENKNWDLTTGGVLETWQTSPLGVVTQNIIVPAYTKYPEFDSKARSSANRNMLSQTAANYSYKLDGSGHQTGLLSASATVWKKDWANYRILVNNNYVNDPDPSVTPIWRTNKNFVWKGLYSRLQADGTQSFSSGDQFNFASGASNPNWQMAGANQRYSHNSTLLETKDLNGVYSASKRGYLDQHTIASATNAHYEEIAFSGAEDFITNSVSPYYFGGEVSLTNGNRVSTPVHTGTNALSVSSGYGFVFKSNALYASKSYRASVWCNSTNGRIYYKQNGGGEITPPVTPIQAGSWYRIDCVIPTGTTSIEVGVKSNTGTAVVFDDFRFQPLQSAMTAYVYDPVTRVVSHTLDNDNLYTRFEYNGRGMLTKTYQESFKYGGEKLVTESKNDLKRFHTNQ